MSYKIAVTSSDGKHIDLSFGSTDEFIIYEVVNNKLQYLESRNIDRESAGKTVFACSSNEGCASGGQSGYRCGNDEQLEKTIESISDCRCILSNKIGFRILKQLEKKAIASFDVDGDIFEVMERIIKYFDRVDNHVSLRGFSKLG